MNIRPEHIWNDYLNSLIIIFQNDINNINDIII